LTDDEGRSLWTVDELARELEDPGVGDHLDELHRSGLIHRTSDGYVLATRPAFGTFS
jgi:hypothetical protein